ncbi:ABC transporter C family protein [Tieghemostelium lacteum]|uniref:ABC transporter C family protein n=1 Tax=Tieghemostelium lacteum TaxID=361077 RepID=A0A152A7A3_TIELA|nr:ABC transporter C family protein [Tieghemostelium lacteum]|eukprot:KYR02108.1 ABC transporter C family protein [Tieghemostelium lacteum]
MIIDRIINKLYFKKYTLIDSYQDNNDIASPEDSATVIEKLFYTWIESLVKKGYRSPLQLRDIYQFPRRLQIDKTVDDGFGVVDYGRRWPLISHFYRKFTITNHLAIGFKTIAIVMSIVTPLVFKQLLNSIQTNQLSMHSLMWCIALFVSSLIGTMSVQHGYHWGMTSAIQVKSSLVSKIYEKMLRLNNYSKSLYSIGKIMNMVSADGDSFLYYFWDNHIELFLLPIQITGLLIVLFYVVGLAGLFGFIVMVVMLPVNTFLGGRASVCYRESLVYNDDRLSLISELINGIQFLKLYAWEKSFIDRIKEKRGPQLQWQWKMVIYWLLSNLLTQSLSAVVLLITLFFYSLFGHQLDVTIAFTSLTIFNNLRKPLEFLPESIQRILKLLESSKRIEDYFKAPEIGIEIDYEVTNTENEEIYIKNAHFDWTDGKGDASTLNTNVTKEINFRAPVGKLTMICGSVGSGKSSLLLSLMGEIHKTCGEVRSLKSVGYTSQQPFLMGCSLRENILFGKPYDRKRYLQVLEACALNLDIHQFPGRDQTEIGERGLNLSGGQKQRIALARALYADCQCLIMDDPLSAVDTRVAKHLFINAINGPLAEGKTRILVTHQLQYLSSADHIALFHNDTLIQGTYEELSQKGINFQSILDLKRLRPESEEDDDDQSLIDHELDGNTHDHDLKIPIDSLIVDQVDDGHMEMSKLIVEEERGSSDFGYGSWLLYARSGGSWYYFLFITFLYVLGQLVFQSSDYWLAIWSQSKSTSLSDSQSLASTATSDSYYLKIYLILIVSFIFLIGSRFVLLSRYALNAAKVLHDHMLLSVTLAPCQFFLENPSGRILNRFSRDVTDIDIKILPELSDILHCASTIIVSMLIMAYLNPYITLPLLVFVLPYVVVQRIYLPTSMELKRMEAVTKSPVFSILQETYQGLITIRVHQQQQRFIQELRKRLELNLRIFHFQYTTHRYMSMRLEIISSLVVLFASFIAVLQNNQENPGISSLMITTAFGMTGFISWGVKQVSDLSLKMNSVERVNTYINIPREGGSGISHELPSSQQVSNEWPKNGNIEFKDLSVRYKNTSDPVLNGITFSIQSQEKIGIVGRTGSGKTTLGFSLFRLVEACSGQIEIDGQDISQMSLYDLRSRLACVPQDPFIFSGSIRGNLDPFNQFSDHEIWTNLELVQLKKLVTHMPLKLNTHISEGGSGLSVGQKQLFCLCRALLRKSKIVLLDESSASLDFTTDSIIKSVIRNYLKESTVITVAHRLDTIIDSDKILVIDQGQLIEFDSPQNLMNLKNSKFSKLVNAFHLHHK